MDRWEEMGMLFAIITRAMIISEKGIVRVWIVLMGGKLYGFVEGYLPTWDRPILGRAR